jgi:hypothetical protein
MAAVKVSKVLLIMIREFGYPEMEKGCADV